MASSQVNPRRSTRTSATRSVKDVESALSLNTNMSLRKSPTFHSPTSSSSSEDDDFVPPSIRRSQTNLEDVIDAHKRRVALIVDDINKSLTISDSTSSLSSTSTYKKTKKFRDTSLPVPRSFLDLPPVVDPAMAKDSEPERRQLRPRNRRTTQQQASDSGLGSSIASTKEEKRVAASHSKKASAITRSAASSSADKTQGLSQRAVNRITEYTLRPLLAKPSLKDFQPIVLDVPRRISEKEIICLRDLEKTLLFMAPERSKSAKLYLDFCLASVKCIKETASKLSHDRELIRPRDRPYTNLYYLDLEEQIRQYARQLAEAKEKPRGGDSDGMDLDSSDEIRLHGGIAKNGQQVGLVRVRKDGTAFSLETGEAVDLDEDSKSGLRLKRSLSQQAEDDEEIMRSMARRKKNASPEELAPKKCREPGCKKEFKRPCDLTKHEKTHSRPWKCADTKCKYHEYGWPTEKERDRHYNDKHSASPATYPCQFQNCPYKSKRESNCKQHMEKAHGWAYVRTKTNGKKGHSKSPSNAPINTPQLTTAPTPQTNMVNTPSTDDRSSPFLPWSAAGDFPAYTTHDPTMGFSGGEYPANLDDIDMDVSPISDAQFDAAYPPSTYEGNFNFSDEELYTAPVHLPTPTHNAAFAKLPSPTAVVPQQMPYHHQAVYDNSAACHANSMVAPSGDSHHLSPIGQANAMLCTPTSLVDEGFEDFSPTGNDLGGPDFELYPQQTKVNFAQPLFGEMQPPSDGIDGLFSQPTQQYMAMDWATHHYQ